MTPRIFAAICVGSLLAGSLLIPVETSARSGGMAGPAIAPRGTMPAPAARPRIVHPPVARPGAHAPPPAPRIVHARPHPRRAFVRHHRRFVGFGWPWWPYGPSYEPYQAATPYAQPAYPAETAGPDIYPAASPPPPVSSVVQHVTRVIVVGQGCDRTTETIPWRDGSERTITMVRC